MSVFDQDRGFSFTLRVLIGLAAFGLVLYFMHLAAPLINALFFAYIIVVVASPLLLWLVKKGAPSWLAFLITLLTIVVFMLALAIFFTIAIAEFTSSLPQYMAGAESLRQAISEGLSGLGLGAIDVTALLELIEPGQILDLLAGFLNIVLGAFSDFLLIGLFVVFMLVQIFVTPQIMRREIASGNSYIRRLFDYGNNLRRYILITTLIGLVTGALDTILFLLLGIPNPFLWGALAFLLSFVPTVGFWLAAIPPTLLGLVVHGPVVGLLTLVGILAINGFADNIVKPKYIGSGLDLAPFLVIFSIIFWVMVLGPSGALLGVPMTMLFKELLAEPDERLSWVARLMGSGKLPQEDTVLQPGETPEN
jgi:AI-2 transport protein TqsA